MTLAANCSKWPPTSEYQQQLTKLRKPQDAMQRRAHRYPTRYYRTAHLDFLIASRRKPADPEIKKQLGLSAEVLALDPMLRELNLRERYDRSLHLLRLAAQSATQCLGPKVPQLLIDEAEASMQRHVRPTEENEAVDSSMDLAEKIWQLRKKECMQPLTDQEQALSLVLIKIQLEDTFTAR